jgi:hypothetical protein
VAQRISRERSIPDRLPAAFKWAIAIVLVGGVLVLWPRASRRETQLRAAAMTQADRALVIQRTQGALTYIGHALIEAAAHTEDAILNEAMPPLRDGLRTAKDKITNSI